MKSLVLVLLACFFLGPFSSLLAQSGDSYAGSWYDPARDGEGFHIEVLPDGQALVIWFTYPGTSDPAEAEQAWILGTGTITGAVITINDAYKTSGPVFGEDYDKANLQLRTWGDLTVTFSGQTSATVSFDGLDGAGSISVIRLTKLASNDIQSSLLPGISGAWFDPETEGQGWFVEILNATTALVYWFTYDENGNQAWNLGVGSIFDRKIVLPDNLAGTGTMFGAMFDPADVVKTSFSMLTFEFGSCSSGTVSYLTADGVLIGSYQLKRLTFLDGYDCGALGEPRLVQSIMTNSTDPQFTDYFGLDGIQIGLFGVKSADGRFDRLTSGFLQTPSGDSINFDVDDEGQLTTLHDNNSDITLSTDLDGDGNSLLVLNDPENGVSASTHSETQSGSQKATPPESRIKTEGGSVESSHETVGGTVVVEVELCGETTSNAQVNFLVNDLSSGPGGSFVLPARELAPGEYQSQLPTSLGTQVDEPTTDSNCSTAADQFAQVCQFIDDNQLVSEDCLRLGQQIGVVNPEASAHAAAVCASTTAALSSACSANELRANSCGPEPDKVFREFASLEITAQARFPGLVITATSETVIFDTPGEELIIPRLVVDGQAYYRGHSVTPTTPDAGDSYTLDVNVGCVNAGQSLTVSNTTNGTSSSCTVDAGGNCQATVTSRSSESVNALNILGPDGLDHDLVQSLVAQVPLTEMEFSDPNLQSCILQYAESRGWAAAGEMVGLECPEAGISSLDGIEQLHSLYYVDFIRNNISDASPLQGISTLSVIILPHNDIPTLEVFGLMPQITYLDVCCNDSISDITPVLGLTALSGLSLHTNNISDISQIGMLSQIDGLLHLYSNPISDISPISSMSRVKNLEIQDCLYDDVSPIFGLTDLEWLRIDDNDNRIPCAEIATLHNKGIQDFFYDPYHDVDGDGEIILPPEGLDEECGPF